jgi:outer membrane protein assembly factor BamB
MEILSQSGELNWKTKLKGGILSTPIICKEVDMVLTTSLYGEISALNISTGLVIWRESLPPVFSTPAVTGEEIVVAPVNGQLLWFALKSGQKVCNETIF